MPGKAQTTGSSLELDVDNSGGGGGGDATAANQIIEIAVLQDIETDVSDVSTETTLALIKSKTDNIPALGQALAAASTPVVLTAAQVTTLTPPAAITGFLTQSDFDDLTGSKTETAPVSDTASSGLNGRLQRIAQRITSLIALLPTALSNGFFQVSLKESISLVLAAGTALVGKVGIDQTTPGTTNAVSIPAIAVSAAVTSVNDSASSQQLLASLATRKGYKLFNDSTIVAYVKEGTTATTSDYSYQIQPKGYYEYVGLGCYTGRIDCIWASDGSGAMKITELT